MNPWVYIAILAIAVVASWFLSQAQLRRSLQRTIEREQERGRRAHDALARVQENLEVLVQRRTEELEVSHRALREHTDMLERYQRVTQGREIDMIRLKAEVNELCQQLGLPPRYRIPDEYDRRQQPSGNAT